MKTSENQSFSVFFLGGGEGWGAIVIERVLIVYFSTELRFYSLVHSAFLIRENCDNINRLDASTEEICLKPNTRFLKVNCLNTLGEEIHVKLNTICFYKQYYF